MSVENTDTIDFIGTDNLSGKIILTISDHLDWTNGENHLRKLQEKLNTYLRFCESGELYKSYPKAVGRHIVFSVVMKHVLLPEGESFLEKVRAAMECAGFELQVSGPKSTE
jgi:hypothetical protein